MTLSMRIRLTVVFFLFIILYGIMITHMYTLQVRRSAFFETIAHNQYHVLVSATPPRAEIYDRAGRPIARNTSRLAAFLIPAKVTEQEKVCTFLKHYFPAALERYMSNPTPYFMYIKRGLTDEDLAHITKSNLEDILLLKEPARFYPVTSLGHVLGITDTDNKGIAGLEYWYDSQLAGTPSTYILERDARSGHYYFNKETRIQGAEGTPLTLTIDSTLQFLVYEELKETIEKFEAQEGAVLILDPTSGDICTMVSYPDFDPNDHGSISLEKTKNRIVTETYELGSVMKVFFALAALEEEVVSPDEIIDCENKNTTFINGIRINTVHADGPISFSTIIEHSNNIGTSKIANRLGTKLYEHYQHCGFGEKTGLNFPGEQRGFLNPPAQWSKQSPYSYSFGYEVSATLLQLARAFSLLTTEGHLVTPRLTNLQPPQFSERRYSERTIRQLREILEKTITQGTARRAKIEGYTILGKTGTANLITDGVYDQNRNIFTFVGLVEKGDYKRIIVTFIKEVKRKNIHAASITAPLFEHVAQKMLIHDHIIAHK